MRLEIDNQILDAAQRAYTGPETSGKGLVVWILKRLTAGETFKVISVFPRRSAVLLAAESRDLDDQKEVDQCRQ